MLNYIHQFSAPFILAIVAWPFLALLLTFPILLIEYIRYRRLPRGHTIIIYFLILYILGLIAFTLYPLPADPGAFCTTHNLSPQLNPLQFVQDLRHVELQASLQLLANLVFFIPLGVVLRNLFGRKLLATVIIAFAVSLTIETAQLTGAFGLYPCAYRLFDVDDLIINTIGAFVGFGFARILPNWSKPAKRQDISTAPGAIHRFITFIGDHLISQVAALILTAPLYFITANTQPWQTAYTYFFLVVFHFLIPFFNHGQTIVGKLTGISLDDQPRKPFHRTLYYLARLALIAGVLFSSGLPLLIILLVTVIWWLSRQKLPYEIIDIIFAILRPDPSKHTKRSSK